MQEKLISQYSNGNNFILIVVKQALQLVKILKKKCSEILNFMDLIIFLIKLFLKEVNLSIIKYYFVVDLNEINH